MNKLLVGGTALAMGLGVAACTSAPETPSFGARLQSQGGDISAIGQKWSKGESAVVEGRALIQKGEENVDDGEALISKGKRQISDGERLVRQGEQQKKAAEEAYRQLNVGPAESGKATSG